MSTGNGLRVNVLSIKIASSVEDGRTFVTAEAETDLPMPGCWLKEKREVGTMCRRGYTPMLSTLHEALEAIERRVAVENYFDRPDMLAIHNLTEADIADYRAQGWKPFFESREES